MSEYPPFSIYHYAWLHIPTGHTGNKEAEFLSRMEFLESINSWNRTGRGVWQYYEVAK